MKKLSVWFSFVFVLWMGATSFAATIVISDIDDTLKQAHVLNRRDMLANSVLTDNPFLGMNGALIALKAEHPEIKFFYVSNAIEKMMEGLHGRFLASNQFPQGRMSLRGSPFDSDFKVKEIRKIIQAEKPTHVIMIGDNGEKDSLFYEQIRKDFPQVKFLTYIHLVYSQRNSRETGSKLQPGQIGYATSFDLLSSLNTLGVISPTMLGRFYANYAKTYLSEDPRRNQGPMAIPAWMDCRDLVWNSPIAPQPGSVFEVVKKKILERCSSEPFLIMNQEGEIIRAIR